MYLESTFLDQKFMDSGCDVQECNYIPFLLKTSTFEVMPDLLTIYPHSAHCLTSGHSLFRPNIASKNRWLYFGTLPLQIWAMQVGIIYNPTKLSLWIFLASIVLMLAYIERWRNTFARKKDDYHELRIQHLDTSGKNRNARNNMKSLRLLLGTWQVKLQSLSTKSLLRLASAASAAGATFSLCPTLRATSTKSCFFAASEL